MISSEDIRNCLFATEKGTILTIEVSPGSKTNRFPTGYNPWRKAVSIQVKAQAMENKANKAIISLIADTLNIPRTEVKILAGHTSSIKKILLNGLTLDSLANTLFNLINQEQ